MLWQIFTYFIFSNAYVIIMSKSEAWNPTVLVVPGRIPRLKQERKVCSIGKTIQ
jgi:hypothetical protein